MDDVKEEERIVARTKQAFFIVELLWVRLLLAPSIGTPNGICSSQRSSDTTDHEASEDDVQSDSMSLHQVSAVGIRKDP